MDNVTTDVQSNTDAVVVQPLKSNDTSEIKAIQQRAEEVAKPEVEKPVKQEAVEDSNPEVDEEQDDAQSADSSKPNQGKNSWKKRIERAQRQAIAETEARIYKELHANQGKPPPSQAEQAPEGKSFEELLLDNDFDQGKAMEAFYNQKRELERKAETAAAEKESRAKAADAAKAKIQAFEERVGEGAMQDIIDSPLNTDSKFKPLIDLFMGDDNDIDIAHVLANDIDEAERLLSLSPLARVREVAKLAEKFGAAAENKPVVVPKKTTNAPPPPRTVSGSGKSGIDLDDPEITPAQRIAEWQRQRSARKN